VPENEAPLSIGEAADRTGLTPHTLRFYEREGILPHPVQRTTSGHRAYTKDEVTWLKICKGLRASGMPLAQIRDFIALIKRGEGNEDQRVALLRRHQDNLAAQIKELRECFAWIEHKASTYEQKLGLGSSGRSSNKP
jgi:DNA-binding transcriptional MerR regulator